ncbi:MAG: hypothetical protein M1823_004829 [Watsoniomyces obsoletus]|nr:MAG: hypothetical protein M1823_004829 [Watsoniomyces obsoletus]
MATQEDTTPGKVRPEKPDESQFRADVDAAEKEHAAVMEKLSAVRAKLDLTKPSSTKSPAQQRQQELRSELASIRQQQQQFKSSRGNLQEKIKALDNTIKSRITEQKNARARVPFKSVDEIDQRIQHLDKQVETGTMKLVDEKKALAEISSLRKQRKGFAQFDEAQKGIDDAKTQLAELRKGLDDPEAKALSERYTAITTELDEIKAEQDEAYKSINSLRDERTKLQAEQQEKYSAIRSIKDKYYSQKKAYADYEHEAYKARRERQKAQRDAFDRERRKKVADERLEEASRPAYLDEIRTAEGLIRYFDPSSAAASDSSSSKTLSPGKFAAQASRTVSTPEDFKGVKVLKKDDREENYMFMGANKKGKKGRRNNNGGTASPGGTSSIAGTSTGTSTPTTEGGSSKFQLTVGVIEELGKVDIEPPMGQADVPAVVEKLKTKLEEWKKDQDRQTKANIEKAQKEIDRLEAAEPQQQQQPINEQPSGSGTAPGETQNTPNGNDSNNDDSKIDEDTDDTPKDRTTAKKPGAGIINGESSAHAGDVERAHEKEAMDDVAKEMEDAKLEDE